MFMVSMRVKNMDNFPQRLFSKVCINEDNKDASKRYEPTKSACQNNDRKADTDILTSNDLDPVL